MRRDVIARAGLTEERLEDLVTKSRDGDERAWAELWLALAPLVERIAGSFRVTSRLSRCPDERRNIVARVMGELRANGFRLLAELGERLAQRDGSYRRWFSTVAIHSALKYARAHQDYLGIVEGGGRRWASHMPLSDTLEDDRPDPTKEIDAHRILADAREELEQAQLDALCRWLRREDFDEIAGALQLAGGAGAAARLVRSALFRLRCRYVGRGPHSVRSGPPSCRRGRSIAPVASNRAGARAGRRGSIKRTPRRPSRPKIDQSR